MGISYNVYVGPYMVCELKKIKITIKETACPKCQNSLGSSFCPSCGSAVEETTRTETRFLDFNEIISDIYETEGKNYTDYLFLLDPEKLYESPVEVIAPNLVGYTSGIDFGCFEGDRLDLDQELINHYVDKFKKDYVDLIKEFEKRCVSVTIKFGIATYSY